MLRIARSSVEQITRAGMPGLLHFGYAPLDIPVFRTVKQVTLRLPVRGIINLAAADFVGVKPENLAKARFAMSSVYNKGCQASDLTAGKAIHTENEVAPWWRVTFEDPVYLEQLRIVNRRDRWSERSRFLTVELADAAGVTWTFDNAAPDVLAARLAEFDVRMRDLADALYRVYLHRRVIDESVPQDIRNQGSQLVLAVQRFLSVGEGSLEELRERRRGLLKAILEIQEGLTEKPLLATVKTSRPVLEKLLDFGAGAEGEGVGPLEVQAVSSILAADVNEFSFAGGPLVADLDRFVTASAEVRSAIERQVTDIYVKATGNKSYQPIIFRAHGMGGPRLRRASSQYVTSMTNLHRALAELGHQAAICYGTLLGAVREKEFIAHDDDVDMAVPLRCSTQEQAEQALGSLAKQLEQHGFIIATESSYILLKVRDPATGLWIDLFPIIDDGGPQVRMYMEHMKIRGVDRGLVLPFGTTRFYDREFLSPASPEGFLADRYGEDWRVPKRMVGHKMVPVASNE